MDERSGHLRIVKDPRDENNRKTLEAAGAHLDSLRSIVIIGYGYDDSVRLFSRCGSDVEFLGLLESAKDIYQHDEPSDLLEPDPA